MTRSISIDDLYSELRDLRSRIKDLERGSVGRLSWSGLPFAAGWANLGGGWRTAGYTIDPNGIVRLRGVVAFSGTPTPPSTIATLPAGYRPAMPEIFEMNSNSGGVVRVDVQTSGAVQLVSVGYGSGYVSLSGVSFSIAA